MGSSCVKCSVYRDSGHFYTAYQTEPNVGIPFENYVTNQMVLSRHSNRTVDATTKTKPSSRATSQELNEDSHQLGGNAQKSARKALKYDSGMRSMADKVQSEFNYFSPITKNNDL